MKKVLHYIPAFEIGGIESLFLSLASELSEDKYEVHLLVEKEIVKEDRIKLEMNNIKIHINNISFTKNIILYYKNLKYILNEVKPDIIHIHSFFTRPLILTVVSKINKIILHAHSSKLTKNETIGKKITDILLKDKYIYLACSKEAGECYFGKNRNIEVIANGINFNNFKYNSMIKKNYIEDLKLENKKIVGMIGRLSYPKNHKFAIDIFEELKKIKNNYVLLLIGNEADEKGIPQLVKEKGLEKEVIFLGARSDIKELLSLIDVYLMPSIFEGLSVGLLEAQASGVQCLVSDAITSKNIVTNNVTVLSLNDSPKIWAEKIIELYSKGREDIDYNNLNESEYSVKAFTKKIEEIYDK